MDEEEKEKGERSVFRTVCKLKIPETCSTILDKNYHGANMAKNLRVITSLLTSCYRLVVNKPISGCVCMACNCLLTINLLQVNKFLVRLHGEYNILVKLCGNTT